MKQKIVIKLGGSALENKDTLRELSQLVKGYLKKRVSVVVVHGGGPAINHALTKKGIQWTFVNGQRRTTPEMMETIENVLANEVNAQIVSNLRENQVSAVGLSGYEDRILFCEPSDPELMQVGKITGVETSRIIETVSAFGAQVPVIAPIGRGASGDKFNINADWAATQIAIALNAKKLIFLTDQVGILDLDRELIKKASPVSIAKLIETGVISGGMCTKVNAMVSALDAGVLQVQVLHANSASRLLTEKNMGTLLTQTLRSSQRKESIHGRAS